MALMDLFFDAESKYANINQIIFFTETLHSVYVDNCEDIHISNNQTHLIKFTLLYSNSGNTFSMLGGNTYPSGAGTVRWS